MSFICGDEAVMKRLKITRVIVFFTIIIFTVAQYSVKAAAGKGSAEFNVHEFSGKDRYETCSLISRDGWKDGCKNIIVVSGENFPDALSAVPLAVKLNAPILLTGKYSLRNCIKDEIYRLNPKNAYIIGGSGVITEDVQRDIEKMNITTDRIGGKNRYETSLKIAQRIGNSGKIFVVAGNDYPDALSAASVAAKEGSPVILSDAYEISPELNNYINDCNVKKSYLLGGPRVISDQVFNDLPDCTRIYGQDRYSTNIKIINKFMDNLDIDNAFIVSGENFPDALSCAPLAGMRSAPVIMTRVKQEDVTGKFFASINSFIKDVYLVGGDAVVPRANVSTDSEGANAVNTLNIPTYDGSNQACHPKVLYFKDGWNGWKYWMVMTPYPDGNDHYENPSIVVSNSGTDWQVPERLENPLTPLPGDDKEHGSDPELVYNPTGNRLELWYRYTYKTNLVPGGSYDSTDKIFRIVSYNGIDWFRPEKMISFDTNYECLSPAIIIENGTYKMWYVSCIDNIFQCMYTRSTDGGITWSNPVKINLNLPYPYVPWHIDVVHTDSGYEIVLCSESNEDTLEGKNVRVLFWNTSKDGINFELPKIILKASDSDNAWDNGQIYRSTFVKVDGIYKLFYSAMDKKIRWHIGLTQGYSLDDLHGYEGDIQ